MTRILQVLCVVIVSLASGFAARAQSGETVTWTRLLGTAVDISINIEGQAYVTAPDGTPWRWDQVELRWRRMSGNFVRITAAEGNRPWAIDKKGVVYRYNGLWWENKDTDVVDVAADTHGNIYITKTDRSLHKWYALRSEWRPFKGTAKHIALSPEGQLWVVTDKGRIRLFDGTSWVDLPGRAHDIALGGTDVVMIVDTDGLVRSWNGVQKSWTVLPGIKQATALSVTPEGKAWVVVEGGAILTNGTIISEKSEQDTAIKPKAKIPTTNPINAKVDVARSPTPSTPTAPVATVTDPQAGAVGGTKITGSSTTTADSGASETRTTKEKITFVNTRKSASALAIGADGSVFGLNKAGGVLRWSNTKKSFDSFPGTLVRIAVDKDGHPWGISTLGRVFWHDGKRWKQIINATASDISIGYDGTVLTASAAGKLYKLNDKKTVFNLIPGNNAALIATGPDGTPWVVRTDKLVQRCDVKPCKVIAQKAKSIAVGPDGSVWIVSDTSRLMRLNKKEKFETIRTPGHTPQHVAVGPSGYPWVVSSNNIALASIYFDRNEGGDISEAAATAASGTVGSGSTSSVVSTSSASSFVFTKNLSFQTVAFTSLAAGSCPQLETDVDGVIWAHNSGGNLEQYDSTKRKFVKRSTGFDGWDHTAFDIAPDGSIWAVTLNPQTGLYREYKGVTKQYTIAGSTNFNDISVAPDGTVYVSVSISGPRYLYYKSPNSNIFKKFSTYDNVRLVSVGAGGDIWISGSNLEARRWNGSTFVKPENVTLDATQLSVGKVDGTVYVRENSTASLYKWNAGNKSFDKVNNLTVDSIVVDGDGRPWICNDTTPIIKRAKD